MNYWSKVSASRGQFSRKLQMPIFLTILSHTIIIIIIYDIHMILYRTDLI